MFEVYNIDQNLLCSITICDTFTIARAERLSNRIGAGKTQTDVSQIEAATGRRRMRAVPAAAERNSPVGGDTVSVNRPTVDMGP